MHRLKINKSNLIAFFLCFSFIPVYAIQLVIGSNGYLILQIISIIYIGFMSIKSKVFIRSLLFVSWFVLMLWMAICSLMNSQNVMNSFYYVGRVAFFFLINDWYMSRKSLKLLSACRAYIAVLILITFLQQLFLPGIFGYVEGSQNARNFFISDNYLGYYYSSFIALCFVLDYVEIGKTRLITYLIMAVCFVSLIRAWVVKNIVGMGLIFLYMIFAYRKKIARILGPRTMIFIFTVITVTMVIFNVNSSFYEIASSVFGKGQSFSVRFYVWAQALRNIERSPIFGYGIPDGAKLILQTNFAGNARSAHNLFIELTLEGGIPALALYVIPIIICLVSNERKFKGRNRYEFLFLLFEVFVFFVMELFSGSIYFPFYYMPIMLIANLQTLIEIKERRHAAANKNLYRYQLR